MSRHKLPVDADQAKLWGHVASLPCPRPGCYRPGPSQVAHSNQQRDGKGMGIKSHPWRVAAMCPACHVDLDSGADLSKQERREAWDEAHRTTMGLLFERGLVRPT
jgi:hypothetical protein